eukprot:m.18089 g.18089  ORF g.18089 m.18089 type:complete len:153 (-) comp29869_c0_seq2:1695-2153(-)
MAGGKKRADPAPQPGATVARSEGTSNPWLHVLDAVLVVVSIGLYINSLDGEFVFDDRVAVEENKDVRPEASSIIDVFLDNYWGDRMGVPTSRHQSYRPVTVLSFRWTYWIFGMNVVFFHLGYIHLHARPAFRRRFLIDLALSHRPLNQQRCV